MFNKSMIYLKFKNFLLGIFSFNLILFTNTLEAHLNQNGLDKGFFIGQMIVYCILESDGVISESEAGKYIRITKSYMTEAEDVDIDIKNYVKNYRFTGVNKPCNKLIP
tara:strand:- start:1185 stop:1508 length:324 start_codon:yes stop_codon:yes gene_type:complete